MANSMFNQFKMMLEQALQDEDFRRKNCIFQNDDYLNDMLSRIQSLTPDVSVTQSFGDIISVLGMIEQDTINSRIKFSTRGFETTMSAFREGLVSEPQKIWYRNVVNSQDKYLVSDRQGGVLILNDSLEALYRFPNFGPDLAGSNQYDDASACCTFTLDDTEYIAITMYSHHVCSIYEYGTPYAHQSTIGVVDTPGDTSGYLNNPVGVAVDAANSIIYIACFNGQPTGATLSRGYVTSYDISDPTSPVFLSTEIYYANSGSLLSSEVNNPTDLFYDGTLLWICNGGSNEVAGISVATSPYRCSKYIEAKGRGYSLYHPQQAFVYSTLGGYVYLYVANGDNGSIEEFDHLTLRHLNTYGYRSSEDNLNSLSRLSDSVYGAIGYAKAVVADRVLIDGKYTDIIVCADTLNKRLHRFNLNAYSVNNFANFAEIDFDVPVMINGWSLSGDIPLDLVKVYYRFGATEEFRELPQETSLAPTSSAQFRVAVQLDRQKFVKNWYIRHLRIHGTQA